VNAKELAASNTLIFTTQESMLEKGFMNLPNVKKPTAASTHMLSSRKSTMEKGLTSVMNVGNLLAKLPT
jgi:hypothetical protein